MAGGGFQILPVKLADGTVEVVEGTGIRDDLRGYRQARFPGGLGGEYGRGTFRGFLVPGEQTLQLGFPWAVHHQYAVVLCSAAGFGQQGNGVNLIGAAGTGTGGRECLPDGRVQNGLQPLPGCGLGKHHGAQGGAVQAPVWPQNSGAERGHDGIQGGLARFNDFTRNEVRIEDGDPPPREGRRNGGFAAGDAASEGDHVGLARHGGQR